MTQVIPRATCVRTLKRATGGVFTVAFDLSGRYCLTGGADRTLRLWNSSTGVLIQTYAGHGRQILSAAASNDSSHLFSGGGDRSAILWDVEEAAITRKLGGPHGHTDRINSVCFAGEGGSVLASASYDASVRLWDARTRVTRPVQTLSHARDSVSAVVASGARILAASVDGSVRVYDVRAGSMSVDSFSAPVTSMALSRDSNCILAVCLGAPICLLDIGEGSTLSTYKGHVAKSFRVDCAVSHDDAFVLSGSEDGLVCMWDIVEGGTPCLQFRNSESSSVVGAVAAHPSKPIILTGDHDGVIKLWAIDTD